MGTAHAAGADCAPGFNGATPVPAAGQIRAAPSKRDAILGGAPSRLAQISAQQAGMLPPLTGPLPASAQWDACTEAVAPPAVQATLAMGMLPPAAPRIGLPDVFGSVAMAISRTPFDANWRRVRFANLGSGPWSAVLSEARTQDRAAQIATINRWVNARIAFVDDIRRHGVVDRWALPAESLTSGQGDCEDYAIAKLGLLRSLGIPAADLYLVIARDLVRRTDHAVLAVRLDDRLVILDNQTDQILDAPEVQDYRPVMTYAADRSWTHGYRVDRDPVAPPLRTALAAMIGGR
ncbi:transglutaminase-like cysteine peptidase [Sphingomonas cavernae]|uniref:transglutaminase-like cysteine peptidase n=1 Tax=Sphingomonas cavernae TaxID=2320861 RepID=UPI001603FC60|nr:transglutaminase-like cysteine peptidase [Sphingomonas cavernae]